MTEIIKRLSDETLSGLKTVEQAISALGLQSAEELEWDSNVYTLLADKSKLIGKKFLAVQWQFHQSAEYEKHTSPQGGALVKSGLKLSEYDRVDAAGKTVGKGKTYYLAN